MKRASLLVLLAVLVVSLLAACGGGNSGNNGNSEGNNGSNAQNANAGAGADNAGGDTEGPKKRVALVLPEKIGVNAFFTQMVDGLNQAAEEFGSRSRRSNRRTRPHSSKICAPPSPTITT